MEIEKCTRSVKCDFYGCHNLAKYSFSTKGLLKNELNFCEDCLRDIYQAIGKLQTPKAIESPFKIKKGAKDIKRKEV